MNHVTNTRTCVTDSPLPCRNFAGINSKQLKKQINEK